MYTNKTCFNTAVFMHKIQGKSATRIFLSKFRKSYNSYPTRFSHLNYIIPIPKLNKCKCGISYRGPFICNNKQITDVPKCKSVANSDLLSLGNEVSFFLYQIFVLLYTYYVCQLN